MNQKTFLALALFLFAAGTVNAATLNGVTLPDSVTVGKDTLVLNGISKRTVTVFKIKLYVAGLYLKTKSTNVDEILKSDAPKELRMVVMMDVGEDTVKNGWTDIFKESCENKCASLEPGLAQLRNLMTSVKNGTPMTYRFANNKVTVLMDGQEKGSVEGKEFAQFVLSTYIGKHAPSKDLSEGLLGMRVIE